MVASLWPSLSTWLLLRERRTVKHTWPVSTSSAWQACACSKWAACSRWEWVATSCPPCLSLRDFSPLLRSELSQDGLSSKLFLAQEVCQAWECPEGLAPVPAWQELLAPQWVSPDLSP